MFKRIIAYFSIRKRTAQHRHYTTTPKGCQFTLVLTVEIKTEGRGYRRDISDDVHWT
jgi:hypothetical protein